MMTEQEPDHWGLVMPFVVCASQGGTYEDQAFVAGWRLGQLDLELDSAVKTNKIVSATVRPMDLPQVDLIAMRYGYLATNTPWEEAPDEWVYVTFEREKEEN
jgi:hypothetical protein